MTSHQNQHDAFKAVHVHYNDSHVEGVVEPFEPRPSDDMRKAMMAMRRLAEKDKHLAAVSGSVVTGVQGIQCSKQTVIQLNGKISKAVSVKQSLIAGAGNGLFITAAWLKDALSRNQKEYRAELDSKAGLWRETKHAHHGYHMRQTVTTCLLVRQRCIDLMPREMWFEVLGHLCSKDMARQHDRIFFMHAVHPEFVAHESQTIDKNYDWP